MMELLTSPEAWVALIMLTSMEIVLGIDNIIFISIIAGKLPLEQQDKARRMGLLLALGLRLLLLMGISWIMGMTAHLLEWGTEPVQSISNGKLLEESPFYFAPTGQAIVLLAGGIFLLYKSIKEIHHKLQGDELEEMEQSLGERNTFGKVLFQIILMDMVFSFDSILTAVGLTSELEKEGLAPLPIMIGGMVLSMLVMLFFAGPVGRFVNRHPSIQMLGLSFLILIGFLLVAEAAHASHLVVQNTHVEPLPKAYLYFAIAFSFTVELLNIRASKKASKVQLGGAISKAEEVA